MKIGIIILLAVISESFTVTNYISHIQNYVNLVSSYYQDGYSTSDFPPLADVSQPMVVNINIHLYAINGFDEVAGNIELVVALAITWTDEMSIIHSISFKIDDRSEFLVPYDMIWTPQLVLTNAIGEASGVGNSAYLCRFDMRTKQVTWKPRVIVSSSCTPDVTYYPFDKQTCEFIYTTWGFLSNEILLTTTLNEWNQDEYGESGEWNIATTSTETYISSGQSFIKFTLNIVRKPLYFAFNILLPVLVLCLLNSTVFLLPAESGERVGFSVTCFLSFMVLLNMIMDIMPRSSSPISFLCYYLVVMMSSSGAMTLVTILLMRVYHKPEKSTVPKWMQRAVTFVHCGCAKLVCCVLCCRVIRSRCGCSNKRRCGCAKSEKKSRPDDILVEITVKDNKIVEHPVEKESQSENKSKCGCFRSCRKQDITTKSKCCCGVIFDCKKSSSEETGHEERKAVEHINQSEKSSCCSFIRNRKNSKATEDNKIITAGVNRGESYLGSNTMKEKSVEDTKTSDNFDQSEISDNKENSPKSNFRKIDAKREDTKEDNPQRSGLDELTQKEGVDNDCFTKAELSLKHPNSTCHGQDYGQSHDLNDNRCFSFLRKKKISSSDIVDIDNDILPLAKGSSESGKFRQSTYKTDATNTEINLLNGWDSNQTDTTNKKGNTLDPINVNNNIEKPDDDNESDTNTFKGETEGDVSLKTHSQRASTKKKKQTQQIKKNLDTNVVDRDMGKRNINNESVTNVVNYQSERDVTLKIHQHKESTEHKTQNPEVKFVKEISEEDVLPDTFRPQRVSRRKSLVSEKQNRRKSNGALDSVRKRGSLIPKHDPDSDDEDNDSVASSEVDSLADLEEEVTWAEVGRILDTFFLLVFTGGQAFFTVVFLVPLFTAQSSTDG